MGPGTVFGDTRSDSWMLQLGLQLKNIIWVRRWMRCEKDCLEIWWRIAGWEDCHV